MRPARIHGLRLPGFLLLATFSAGCGDMLGMGGSGRPEILSVAPEAGFSGVSVLAEVKIRFSTELDPRTVSEAVHLRAGSREVRTRMTLRNLSVLHMEPTDPLDFGTSYEIVVETTLLSRSGEALGERRSWGFTTEGRPFPSPDVDSLRVNLAALAHDSMRGRGSGTEDEYRAARFLLSRFEGYRLDPAPGGGLQSFLARSRKTETLLSSQNVLAVVPGAGVLGREWVVVGAHYDHLGFREQADGSMGIHNGADDNASGTALVLEMARIFRAQVTAGGLPSPDRRSVLFAAFGAEEEGLLGSCHYALEAPAAPIALTRAMMNLDMVGRLRDGVLQVSGLETSDRWANLVVNSNSPGLILFNPPPCLACSDFACFRDGGVPYIGFSTGTHPEYHTPADDIGLISFPGLVGVGEVGLRVLSRLVVMPEGPSSPLG